MNLIERKKINPNSITKGFPLLAMEQFERLILSHNVEFRGGFYIQTNDREGNSREAYVPDTREVFCNTCRALAILAFPKFSKSMKEKYDEVLQKLEDLKRHFIEATGVNENIVLGEAFYESTEDKILLEQYNNTKVILYRELFEALSIEFSNHRYWASQSSDD